MKKLNLLFPEPLMAKLKEYHTRSGLSMSDIIRRALEEYLQKVMP